MKIGYARVSTEEQNLEMQIAALQEAGCEMIFQEHISGMETSRPELEKMNSMLRKGDEVVIWKLDRLGRSTKHLIELVESFKNRQVGFICLNGHIDTSTPQGQLIFTIFAGLAEFERMQTRERTMAGLANARKNGRIGGRPRGLSPKTQAKANRAVRMYNDNYAVSEIGEMLQLSRATIYRYLKMHGIKKKK